MSKYYNPKIRRLILFYFAIVLFIFLFLPNFGFAAQSELYCFFDRELNYHCQQKIAPAAQKVDLVQKGQLIFWSTPFGLNLNTAEYKFLIIRLKSKIDYPFFHLNFFETKTGAWPLDDLTFIFRKSGKFSDYYFDLSKSIVWRDTANRLAILTSSDIEIESFKIVKKSAAVFLKTIWQEFLTIQPERFFWIYILPEITVNNISVMIYLFIFVLIVIAVLTFFKIRDKDLQKQWSKIILIVFLIFWFVLEFRMIYENINWLRNDILNLRNLSPNQKREALLNQMTGGTKIGSELYAYFDFVKTKIPTGAKIFLYGNSDYPYILLTHHLVEQYQLVREANRADYFLVYNLQPEDSFLAEFEPLAAFGPDRLIFKRK